MWQIPLARCSSLTVMAVSGSRKDGVQSTSWYLIFLVDSGTCYHFSLIVTYYSVLFLQRWRAEAWICQHYQKRSGTNWRSWIWSCLKVRAWDRDRRKSWRVVVSGKCSYECVPDKNINKHPSRVSGESCRHDSLALLCCPGGWKHWLPFLEISFN